MKKNKYNWIIIIIIIIIIIGIIYRISNINNNNNNPYDNINKCIPYGSDNITACISNNSIIYQNDLSSLSSQIIERKTLKSVLNYPTKYKLMNLDNIFTPSMMYGTFCNKIYTTYYDFKNGHFKSNTISFLKEKQVKRVRIRHYYFDPNSYFEIKYKDHKIRVLIDCQYNILEDLEESNKNIINEILYQIKKGEIPVLFYNEYKRFSFIYKQNLSIRMTIDTDIKIKYAENIYTFPFDILEVKYNINIPKETVITYFKDIEREINIPVKLNDFSKVDYTIENIIIPYKEKQMLQDIKW